MSIERRLGQGPLRVRSLWDPALARELPALILARRRERFVVHSALVGAGLIALFSAGWSLRSVDPSVHVTRAAIPSEPGSAHVPSVSEKAHDPGEVRLTDGSRILGVRPGQVVLAEMPGDSVRAELRAGSATFEVTKNARRTFEVVAGDIRVQVVGTRFTVNREAERAHVDVSEGRVRVVWPEGETLLSAGESGWFPPPSADAKGTPARVAPPRTETRAPDSNASPRWRQLATDKEYDASFRALQAEGPFLSSAEDLLLAADVARRSRHPGQAVRWLAEVSRRFPSDPRAPLAEFTRGRVLLENLGQAAVAAEAFARARTLAPSGPLAEDAWMRQIDATRAAGSADRARALAREYLGSYPRGRYRARCDELLSD